MIVLIDDRGFSSSFLNGGSQDLESLVAARKSGTIIRFEVEWDGRIHILVDVFGQNSPRRREDNLVGSSCFKAGILQSSCFGGREVTSAPSCSGGWKSWDPDLLSICIIFILFPQGFHRGSSNIIFDRQELWDHHFSGAERNRGICLEAGKWNYLVCLFGCRNGEILIFLVGDCFGGFEKIRILEGSVESVSFLFVFGSMRSIICTHSASGLFSLSDDRIQQW